MEHVEKSKSKIYCRVPHYEVSSIVHSHPYASKYLPSDLDLKYF